MKVAQSCPALCDLMDYSPPGFSVLGILQSGILEWVVISFSRRSSRPKDQTQVSWVAGRFFTTWVTRETCFKKKDILHLNPKKIPDTYFNTVLGNSQGIIMSIIIYNDQKLFANSWWVNLIKNVELGEVLFTCFLTLLLSLSWAHIFTPLYSNIFHVS